MDQAQNQRYWRRVAAKYDLAMWVLSSSWRAWTSQAAQDLSEALTQGRVLEIAAGTGLVTAALVSKGLSVVATDMSPEMLAVLKGRMAGRAEVEVRVADALALDFADGSFEAVLMANVLHLLPKPEVALGEAQRVLMEGGVLCVPTFCHGQGTLARAVSRVMGLAKFPIVTRFTAQSLTALVERAGFEVLTQRVFPGLLPLGYVFARKAEPSCVPT